MSFQVGSVAPIIWTVCRQSLSCVTSREKLREVLDEHLARGSRLTLSQAVRYAILQADFKGLPDVP